ncbi:RNA polymerase sigma factor, partial [Actinomadura adrarensis]
MADTSDDEQHRRELFERLYGAHYDAVARYALRRTDSPDDAVDVLGETFMTAWRRLEDIPDGDNATRLWLYGVAR